LTHQQGPFPTGRLLRLSCQMHALVISPLALGKLVNHSFGTTKLVKLRAVHRVTGVTE